MYLAIYTPAVYIIVIAVLDMIVNAANTLYNLTVSTFTHYHPLLP